MVDLFTHKIMNESNVRKKIDKSFFLRFCYFESWYYSIGTVVIKYIS